MQVLIRKLERRDRPIVAGFLSGINQFYDEDRVIALELIDIFLDVQEQKDYDCLVACDEINHAVGFICFGPTPLTDGTFDLYWIAVDPVYEGKGVGTLLLESMETMVKNTRGRMIIIETSSGQEYSLTRKFYLKNNYLLAETIKDFYHLGEDRVTFIKRF